MALETRKFFEIAQANGLVSNANLAKLKNAIKKEQLSNADLNALIAKKVISKWQAQRMLTEKPSFKLGEYQLLDFLGKDSSGEVYLIRGAEGTGKRILRLVSKSVTTDAALEKSYRQRIEYFQKPNANGIQAIEQVADLNKRLLVITPRKKLPTLEKVCQGKPQSALQLEDWKTQAVVWLEALQSHGVQHGFINEHAILVGDDGKLELKLPADISFHPADPQPQNDVASVARVLAGAMAGDFESPDAGSNSFIAQLLEVASQDDPPIHALNAEPLAEIVGTADVDQSAQVVGPDDGVPPLPFENSLPPVEIESVDANTLGDIAEPQQDMFGDLDQIEVHSEIAPIPQIVETKVSLATPAADAPDSGKQQTSKDQADPSPNSKRNLILSIVGGSVAVLIVVVVIVMNMGGDGGSIETAKNTGASSGQSKAATSKEQKDSSSAPVPSDKEKNGDDAENENSKDSKAGSLGTTSSGLFSNVGINKKDDPNPLGGNPNEPQKNENIGAQPKVIPGGKQPQPKNVGNPPKVIPGGKKTVIPGGKNPAGLGGGTKSPMPTPDTKNPAETKTTKTEGKNETKADPPKKGDPDPKDAKKKEEPAGPVILVGGGKNKPDPEAKTAQLKNPFVAAPKAIELPAAGSDLFKIDIPPSLPLTLTLHGGDKAAKAKIEFTMRASTSQNSTWIISAATQKKPEPIAHITFDGSSLKFAWKTDGDSVPNRKYLKNCVVKIQASEFVHVFALREPVVSSMINFENGLTTSGEAVLGDLPDLEHVKIALVKQSKEFPEFSYPKNQKLLDGKSGEMILRFKKENIDVVASKVTARSRGSKYLVNFESSFVTPDKQFVKLTSFKRFEQQANSVLGEIQQLLVNYNLMMAQYNKLQNEQQKRAFSTANKKREFENQTKAAKPIKKHYENTLQVLKKLQSSTIGFRVYYQAGEYEVDLATPSGKPFVKPAPPKKEPAKK